MRNTRWIYRERRATYKNRNYSRDILSILEYKGISGDENIEKFFNSSLKNLRNPFDLEDVEELTNLIIKLRKENKKIFIYGDYDVDGVTSTTIFYLALKEIGIEVDYYIPLRDEGYGLNKDAIKEIKNKGADLIITVDCGISSFEEIEYANEIGMDIVITDHHEINGQLPNALAVINCKRKENKFSFDKLAGVGTAFMVLLALYKKLNIEEKIYKYLDIVAIGTVADIVPLVEDNRIIVKNGLRCLKKTKWKGLKFLIRKLYKDLETKEYNTYDIGFRIAPVFNAAGRLEDAKKSVQLLVSNDNKECDIISYELINRNNERKNIQESILEKVEYEIQNKKLYEKSALVIAKEGLHSGVIGIVASKIVDKYYKPTVVLDIKKEDGVAVGSCRSIEDFNIIEALNSMKELFLKYGGHSGAAGFSIEVSNIEKFSKRLDDYVKENLGKEFLLKPIKIDKNIEIYKISYDFLKELSLLEPFGFGNSTPIFSIENCKIMNLRKIGKEKNHLMFDLVKNNIEIKNCVWFSSVDMFDFLSGGSYFNLAFKLKLEIYRNKYQYKIFIEDIKKSMKNLDSLNFNILESKEIYETKFPIETVFYTRKKVSEDLKLLYHEDKVYISDKKSSVGELDGATSYILKKAREYFGYNFSVFLENIIPTEENFNVFIRIERNYSFETYKIKNSEIFRDIKNYLLGDLNYNSFQREVLNSIFIKKQNILGIYSENRGIGIIIKTIGLYYKNIEKKAILITKKNSFKRKEIEKYIEISDLIKKDYDFYIFLDFKSKNYPKKSLILSKEQIEINEFKKIEDKFNIPKNVEINLEEKLLLEKNIWSRKLSRASKIEIQKKLKKGEKIVATDNIKVIL